MFNQTQIKEYIPQREPFLFVDEIVEFVAEQRVKAVLHLTGQEVFFRGHFPDQPVMPGVLLLEHMAQAANFLITKSREMPIASGAATKFGFGMVNRARFLKPVIPPVDVVTEVTAIKLLSNMGSVEAVSFVGQEEVAQATIQFGVLK